MALSLPAQPGPAALARAAATNQYCHPKWTNYKQTNIGCPNRVFSCSISTAIVYMCGGLGVRGWARGLSPPRVTRVGVVWCCGDAGRHPASTPVQSTHPPGIPIQSTLVHMQPQAVAQSEQYLVPIVVAASVIATVKSYGVGRGDPVNNPIHKMQMESEGLG